MKCQFRWEVNFKLFKVRDVMILFGASRSKSSIDLIIWENDKSRENKKWRVEDTRHRLRIIFLTLKKYE